MQASGPTGAIFKNTAWNLLVFLCIAGVGRLTAKIVKKISQRIFKETENQHFITLNKIVGAVAGAAITYPLISRITVATPNFFSKLYRPLNNGRLHPADVRNHILVDAIVYLLHE